MALSNIQIKIVVSSVGVQNAQQVAAALQNVGTQAQASSKLAQNSTTGWSNFGKELGNIERNLDAVFRAASHLQSMGNTIRKFGQEGMKALQGTTKAWEEYEFTLNRAAGALEIFDVQAPMYDRLQQSINDVAKEVRVFPADEVAEAMYFWGSTTGQVVESEEDLQILMKGITPILKAAAITETDYGTAIKGVYSILQQYNMGLEQAGDVTAMLMLSTQKTALEFPDLVNAFKMVGPVASQTGASFEDVVQILGYLGDAGIRGTMAGRALRQMFIRMVKPTAIMTSTMDELVVTTGMTNKSWHELTFPEGEFVGARKYIDLLAQATQNLNQDERQRVLAIMATANELGPLTVLINDQIKARAKGVHILDEEKYALDNATESFEKMFSLLRDSWKGTLGYLSNSIGPVVRLIGANVANMAKPFIEWMSEMAKKLEEFLKSNPKIVEWTIRIASAASAVMIFAGVLISAIGVLVGLGAALVFVVKASGAFYTNILKNIMAPIRILSVIIPAIVSGLITNFGGLRDAIGNLISAFLDLWSKLDFSGLDVNSVLGRLADKILPALERGVEIVAGLLNGVAEALLWISQRKGATDLLQTLVTAAATFIALRFTFAIIGLSAAFTAATGTLMGLVKQMVILAAHPLRLGGMFKGMATMIKVAVLETIFQIQVLNARLKMLWATMSLAKAKAAIATGAMFLLRNGLLALLGATGIGALIIAIGLLWTAFDNNFLGIRDIVGNVIEWIMDKLAALIDGVTNVGEVIGNVFGAIGDAVDGVADALAGPIGAKLTDAFAVIGVSASSAEQQLRQTAQDMGMSFEAYRDRVLHIMDLHGKDVESAMAYVTYSMKDKTTDVTEWVSDSMSEATRDWSAILKAGKSDVDAGAAEAVAGIDDAVASEMDEAAIQTEMGLNDIINKFSESKPAMEEEMKALTDAINAPFSANKRRLQIEAELSSQAIQTGLRSEDPRIRAQTAQFVEERVNQYEQLAPGALSAGKTVNPELSEGMGSNINLAVNAAKEICRQTSDPIEFCSKNSYGYGANVSKNFAAGIRDHAFWAKQASQDLAAAGASSIRGYSPPKEGPLKHVDKFGMNIGKTWAEGLGRAAESARMQGAKVAKAARDGFYEASGSGMGNEFTTSGEYEKHIVLDINVSSPDGTVNGASASQLNDIFTSDEFISSLEHMATVS